MLSLYRSVSNKSWLTTGVGYAIANASDGVDQLSANARLLRRAELGGRKLTRPMHDCEDLDGVRRNSIHDSIRPFN